MPAGLDGNPDPFRSPARTAVLEEIALEIESRPRRDRVLLVAIDGIDGAGKSTFADELAAVLGQRGVDVIRSTIDSFHNPRAIRWAEGRFSPEGFYFASHDLVALRSQLLDPISRVPPHEFRIAWFDEPSDTQTDVPMQSPTPDSVLLFDGIFLQRSELRDYWGYSVYLDAADRVTHVRTARACRNCPAGLMMFVHLVGWWGMLERYVGGQRLYHDDAKPMGRASVVVDNNDWSEPFISSQRASEET